MLSRDTNEFVSSETTRKIKMCVPSTSELLSEDELRGIKARISCDAPNAMLESFSGKYISIDDNTTHPLSAKNILLRVCEKLQKYFGHFFPAKSDDYF